MAERKFGGAKIHYTWIYNTHAIDPVYAESMTSIGKLLRIMHLVFPILIIESEM